MRKKKIYKIILIIILILLLLFLIHFVRNYIIISKIAKKQEEIGNSTNYSYTIKFSNIESSETAFIK